jgi:hypothetical protein
MSRPYSLDDYLEELEGKNLKKDHRKAPFEWKHDIIIAGATMARLKGLDVDSISVTGALSALGLIPRGFAVTQALASTLGTDLGLPKDETRPRATYLLPPGGITKELAEATWDCSQWDWSKSIWLRRRGQPPAGNKISLHPHEDYGRYHEEDEDEAGPPVTDRDNDQDWDGNGEEVIDASEGPVQGQPAAAPAQGGGPHPAGEPQERLRGGLRPGIPGAR